MADSQNSDKDAVPAGVERTLKPLLSTKATDIENKLSDLENASLILLLSYTMNSLFWVYLATQGTNPKTHNIKRELDRIQKYMSRATVVSERLRGDFPQINKDAAKRFIRGALYDQDEKQSRKRPPDSTTETNKAKR